MVPGSPTSAMGKCRARACGGQELVGTSCSLYIITNEGSLTASCKSLALEKEKEERKQPVLKAALFRRHYFL